MTQRLLGAFIVSGLVAGGMTAGACLQAATVQTPPATWCPSPASTTAQTPQPPNPTQEQAQYVVGRNDTLRIAVSPDVGPEGAGRCSGEYTVGVDGKINFCMLGGITIEGLTERGIEAFIRDTLREKDIYTNAIVTAEVTKARSQSVYVNGEVGTPGQVFLDGRQEMTLMHAINAAGNYTVRAGPDVIILRPRKSATGVTSPVTPDDVTAQRFTYSRKTLMATMEDPPVQDGDSIWVSQAELFFINGEVRASGQKVWEPCMTVGDAIALASGLSEKASLRRSYIRRKNAKGTFDRIGGLKEETPILPKDELVIRPKLF